jgi:TPR repeat protein
VQLKQRDLYFFVLLLSLCFPLQAQQRAESEEFYHVKQLAEQGDAGAQASLAQYYKTGTGTDRSLADAVMWFSRSSAQGNAAGHFGLGRMYYRGQGVEQDYVKSFRLYELAAQSGHASAQAALGFMSDNGLGTQVDQVQAMKWYLLSAEKWFTANNYVYYMRQKMTDNAVEQARKLAVQYKEKYYAKPTAN